MRHPSVRSQSSLQDFKDWDVRLQQNPRTAASFIKRKKNPGSLALQTKVIKSSKMIMCLQENEAKNNLKPSQLIFFSLPSKITENGVDCFLNATCECSYVTWALKGKTIPAETQGPQLTNDGEFGRQPREFSISPFSENTFAERACSCRLLRVGVHVCFTLFQLPSPQVCWRNSFCENLDKEPAFR